MIFDKELKRKLAIYHKLFPIDRPWTKSEKEHIRIYFEKYNGLNWDK